MIDRDQRRRSRRTEGVFGAGLVVVACAAIGFLVADEAAPTLAPDARPQITLRALSEAPVELVPGAAVEQVAAVTAPGRGVVAAAEPAAEPVAAPTVGEDEPAATPALLSGRVVDPAGDAQAGAIVRVRSMGRGGGETQTLEADALGRFQLALPAGGAALSAELSGLAPSEGAFVRLEPGSTHEVVLALRAAAALRGTVVTATGEPAAGAQVRVAGGRWSGRDPAEVTADAEGGFTVVDVAEGLYTVSARLDGYVQAVAEQVPVSLEHGGELELALAPAGRVEGALRLPDGQPLVGGWVFPQAEGPAGRRQRTDEQGRFVLAGLPAGALELFVRADDYGHSLRTRVEVVAGQVSPLEVVVPPGPRITGVLRDAAGDPLADLVVRATGAEGGVRRQATSDAEGRFVVENLYAGTYTVRVASGRRGPALAEAQVELAAVDQSLELVVPRAAQLRGVVEGPDGQPVEGAGVYAIVDGDYRGQVRTDEAGGFAFDELPSDRYRIFVRVGDDALVGQVEHLELHPGQAHSDLRIRVTPPPSVRVRLVDEAQQPLGGVTVEVVADGAPVVRRDQTDAEGRATLAPLYAGTYTVRVREAGLALAARKRGDEALVVEPLVVRVDAADLEVRLRAVAVAQ